MKIRVKAGDSCDRLWNHFGTGDLAFSLPSVEVRLLSHTVCTLHERWLLKPSSFTTQLIYPYFSDKNSLSLGLLPSGYHLPPSPLLCSPTHVSLLHIYQDFSSPIMFFTTIFLASFNVKADDPIQQSFFGFLIPSLLRTSII